MASNTTDESANAVELEQLSSHSCLTLQSRSISLPIRSIQKPPHATDSTHSGIGSHRTSAPQLGRKTLVPKSRIKDQHSPNDTLEELQRRLLENFVSLKNLQFKPRAPFSPYSRSPVLGVALRDKTRTVDSNAGLDKKVSSPSKNLRYSTSPEGLAFIRKPKRKARSMEEERAAFAASMSPDNPLNQRMNAYLDEQDLMNEKEFTGRWADSDPTTSPKSGIDLTSKIIKGICSMKKRRVDDGARIEVQAKSVSTGRSQFAMTGSSQYKTKKPTRGFHFNSERLFKERIAVWKD